MYTFIKQVPWHRLYNMVMKMTFEKFVAWLADYKRPPHISFGLGDFNNEKSSGVLEEEFFSQSLSRFRGRDLSQTHYLSYAYAINYMEKMDYIVRLETIEEDLRKIPFINPNVIVPVINESNEKRDWRVEINAKTEPLIYEWAKEDFFNFNYERMPC